MTAGGDASVKCPGCGAACALPDRPEAAMRIHCAGCDRRFDAIRTSGGDAPFRGDWSFEAVETTPAPERMRDISCHPWLRRVRIEINPTPRWMELIAAFIGAVVAVGMVVMWILSIVPGVVAVVAGLSGAALFVGGTFSRSYYEEIGIRGRDLVWTIGVGRLRWRRTFTARYVQEMAPYEYSVPNQGVASSAWAIAANTSLGTHWGGIARTGNRADAELDWLANHMNRGIELDKLMDEEREPGRSPAPGRPRRRSGRRR